MTTESKVTNNGPPAQRGAFNSADLKQRLNLIRAYREDGMSTGDPLRANLAVINADLMLFTARIETGVEASLENSESRPEAYQDFERRGNMLLKFARQIDRMSQIDHHLSSRTE